MFEEHKERVNFFKEETKIRDFNWTSNYFENPNKTTFNFAERLISEGIIIDVYVDEERKVVIEYRMDCKTDINNLSNAIRNIETRKIQKFKIPLDFEVTEKAGCQFKHEYNCTFYGCPIILAGYIYHNRYNLKKLVEYRGMADKLGIKDKSEIVVVDEVISDELKEKHKDIFSRVDNNFYIPDNIKKSFYKLIKTLDNYSSLKDSINVRPNLNYVFSDNTDTINQLTSGQLKCIDQYIDILKYFDILKDNYSTKIVDFKEIKEKDYLIDENYSSEVIILHNIYIVSSNIKTEISNERQLLANLVKTKFPSYILNNKSSKIFIICDKQINIENFYSNFNQMKPLFTTLNIPELKVPEILSIFMKKANNPKYNLKFEENFEENLKKYLEINYMYAPYKNLEFVDYIFSDSISKSLTTDSPKELKINNFTIFRNSKNEDYLSLDKLIGLDNVKTEIRNLQSFLEFKNNKEKLGEKMPKIDLHMVYLGNPGTGKTTVARLMAGILFNMGYIRYNKCLECESKDLIANITGETAMKTSEKIQEALGGVLFIDEAYALGESDYGKECIATLIKAMEDFRDDLVVILAGYDKEMMRFLEVNSGFKSRVAYYLDFKDYTNEELLQMMELNFEMYGFQIKDSKTRERINQLCTTAKKAGQSFGNGRFVRRTVDKILRQHAVNTVDITDEEIKNHIILPEDIKLI